MRILITGATRGLGLATARVLARAGHEVIASGRDGAAVRRVAAETAAVPVVLDLAAPAHVREAAADLGQVDAVVANAGLQLGDGPTFTAGNLEETLAVNVLGHVALIDALLDAAAPPGRVVLLGSSTHDPAAHTGMPAPVEEPDLAALARGELATSGRQRYSTSKLLCTALAGAYARERPQQHWTCFDPGLMPGTGLARAYPRWARALWRTAMRGLVVLPQASTPGRSGSALARLAVGTPRTASGGVVDARLRPGRRSARAADPGYQDAVLAAARAIVAQNA